MFSNIRRLHADTVARALYHEHGFEVARFFARQQMDKDNRRWRTQKRAIFLRKVTEALDRLFG